MKRVILSSFIALLIIGSIAAGYFYYQQIKAPHSEAMNAIPSDAAYILECNNFKASWQKLSQTSLWVDLLGSSYFNSLTEDINYLDSTLGKKEDTQVFLKNYPFFISAHNVQNKGFDLLFLVNLPPLKRNIC